MRILMLSHGYPPTVSGVTLVVQKIARAMVERGHEVSVVTASDRGTFYKDEDQGVELWRVRSAPNPFWSEGRLPLLSHDRLSEIVQEVKPDIINTHDSALLSWQLYRDKQSKYQAPEVLTCHFLPQFVTYYVHAGDAIEHWVEEITWDVTLRLMHGFDHIIFPTGTQRAAFIQEGLSVSSSVISNGLDTERYSPSESDAGLEARYGLPPRPRILCVGRLALDKKIDILIRSMAALDQAHLLIAGRGDDRPELENLVRMLDLAERVHFLGFVAEADLPALYRACDVYAIASDVEVQSIPTLQAAASGLPIVAADAAALPELVKDGVNGYLATVNDPAAFAACLGRIVENPALAKAMGAVSLRFGRQHSDVFTYQAYEDCFQQAIKAFRHQLPRRG